MQDPNFVKNAFDRIANRYVITNHILSAGTDILWRKKAGRIVKEWNPKTILDLATGTGDLALELQQACPDVKMLGVDFSAEMLAHATKRGVQETRVGDAMNLKLEDASFDMVSVAFGLRNMANWGEALQEMSRVIKPSGHLLVLDFSLPKGAFGKVYEYYLNNILPKIAGAVTNEKDAYEYLAGSIGEFPSGEEMCKLIDTNGFQNAKSIKLSGGIASIYTADK